MDWRERGACRDAPDPDLWFPTGSSGPALLQIAEAKAVCRGCPSVAACLAWALETGQPEGVWGGLTPEERRALRRRNAPLAPQRVGPAVKPTPDPGVSLSAAVAVPGAVDASWGQTSRARLHVLGPAGRGLCGARVHVDWGVPAGDAPVDRRCKAARCRRVWVALDARLDVGQEMEGAR